MTQTSRAAGDSGSNKSVAWTWWDPRESGNGHCQTMSGRRLREWLLAKLPRKSPCLFSFRSHFLNCGSSAFYVLASWEDGLRQFGSVAQSCLTLCDPMDCSTQGLPVHHQLPEFTQTYVHRVGDAIQPSHPLSSPYPPAFNLSQHQCLFKWVSFFASGGQCIGVSASASALPMNIQDSFPLEWTAWVSSPSKGLSRVFSNTTVQKHQFFGTQLSL